MQCRVCGSDTRICDACLILCGENHLEGLPSGYRGHDLCGHCISSWKTLDKLMGRETSWKEFLDPQPKMLQEVRDGKFAKM